MSSLANHAPLVQRPVGSDVRPTLRAPGTSWPDESPPGTPAPAGPVRCGTRPL